MMACVEEDRLALHISGAQMVLKMGRGRPPPPSCNGLWTAGKAPIGEGGPN